MVRALLVLPLLAVGVVGDAAEGIKMSKEPTISVQSSNWWPFSGGLAELNKELLEAAQGGHLSKVKIALDKGAEINAVDQEGTSSTLWASYNGHADVLTYLLSRGGSVEKGNHEGNTPLIGAAFTGRVECMKILLDHGADIEGRNKNQDTALIGSSFFGQYHATKLLIARGANLLAQNKDKHAPLYLAEHKKHTAIAELIRRAMDGSPVPEASSSPASTPAPVEDPVQEETPSGPPSSWSPAAVQGWINTLQLPAPVQPLKTALWRAKVDGDVLLDLSEIDFYGDRCQWTRLCNVPFVGVKKFLRHVRQLQEGSASAFVDASGGSHAHAAA